jgi:hypothetical protein
LTTGDGEGQEDGEDEQEEDAGPAAADPEDEAAATASGLPPLPAAKDGALKTSSTSLSSVEWSA